MTDKKNCPNKNTQQLMMMRLRGLSGPLATGHKCVPKLSKSVGNFIAKGIVNP